MIRASDWRPLARNSLLGFVTLSLEPSGIVLHDCTFHSKDGREWVGLPGKPQVGKDGQLRKDQATGKVLYAAVIEIPDKEKHTQFQKAAVSAVRHLLGERGAP